MNLSDTLHGPMVVEFLNGNVLSVNIDRVIMNPEGEPIVLVEPDDTMYNWKAIVQVRRH